MSWMPTAIKHQRQTLIPLSSMWRTLPALSSTSPSSCSSPCSSSSSQIMQSFRFILWQRWAARVLRSFSTVQPGRTTTHGPLGLPGLSWLPWTVQLHFHPCPADAAGEKRPVPVRERWWWWCRWYLTYSGFVCQIFDLNHFPLVCKWLRGGGWSGGRETSPRALAAQSQQIYVSVRRLTYFDS